MKTGTICSKHNSAIESAETIQSHVSYVMAGLRQIIAVEKSAGVRTLINSLIIQLDMADDCARDIVQDLENCLVDGQNMEKAIQDRNLSIQMLEAQVRDLTLELNINSARDYDSQMAGDSR